jgi:hypothetical protein
MAYKSFVDQRLTLNFLQASFLPDRGDTHSTQGASTVLLDHNAFNFNNVESDVEDEGEWHDELTHKEPAGHPTRASEAKVLEVRSMQSYDSSLIFIIIERLVGRRQYFVTRSQQPEYGKKQRHSAGRR